MTASIRWLLDHPARAQAIGALGPRHVRSRFVMDAGAERFGVILRGVLLSHTTPYHRLERRVYWGLTRYDGVAVQACPPPPQPPPTPPLRSSPSGRQRRARSLASKAGAVGGSPIRCRPSNVEQDIREHAPTSRLWH